MSEASDSGSLNLYEEELNDETIKDFSSQNLEIAPTINIEYLCVLYLQNNNIKYLPDHFFPSLPYLMWLDLRSNHLTEVPLSIKGHQSLTHLLLQNNKLTSLPNELGTVPNLKVLQLNGNPLMYPPRDVINSGVKKIIEFLHKKYIDISLSHSDMVSEDTNIVSQGGHSFNSVLIQSNKKNVSDTGLSVQFSEKEIDDDNKNYASKVKGKCPKLARSRMNKLPYSQSSKYLKPVFADDQASQMEKIKLSYLKDKAWNKHKNLLATREKVIQGRKNIEVLKSWQMNYKNRKSLQSSNGRFFLDPNRIPYDVNPEYMTLLSREDIEKDLPNKYRKGLIRKSKPTVPRKNTGDVHLAMKIKELFENLEAIDLNRTDLSPRTEQKVLLNEIQKISEIKTKLIELSSSNAASVMPLDKN